MKIGFYTVSSTLKNPIFINLINTLFRYCTSNLCNKFVGRICKLAPKYRLLLTVETPLLKQFSWSNFGGNFLGEISWGQFLGQFLWGNFPGVIFGGILVPPPTKAPKKFFIPPPLLKRGCKLCRHFAFGTS